MSSHQNASDGHNKVTVPVYIDETTPNQSRQIKLITSDGLNNQIMRRRFASVVVGANGGDMLRIQRLLKRKRRKRNQNNESQGEQSRQTVSQEGSVANSIVARSIQSKQSSSLVNREQARKN